MDLDTIKQSLSGYLSDKKRPSAFLLFYYGRHTSGKYKFRNLDELLTAILDAYEMGLDEAEGEYTAFAKIDGRWHELCTREEDGTLTFDHYVMDEDSTQWMQRVYRQAEKTW